MNGLTVGTLTMILFSALLGLHFHIRLKREQCAHKKTEKVLQTAKALLRLSLVAATPGSSRVYDYYKTFLELVPSGKPGDVGLEYPPAEIERIRQKCTAITFLCDMCTLCHYIKHGTESMEDEVAGMKRRYGTNGVVGWAGLGERILNKLKDALQAGRWNYEDIGTSEREIGEIFATLIRRSGTDIKEQLSAYKEDAINLQETVKHLSEKLGGNYLPILETALAQKTPAEPEKEAERQTQA